MVKFSAKSHTYEETWSTVTLAFFLRYPNPYAAHVISCDVLSRTPTPEGSLITKRLMLKRGAVPKWLPRGIVSRAESWIVEESEVDPWGKVVRCTTKNLDHVKVLSVKEAAVITEAPNGSTIHRTEARLVSNFGWGLAKRIERYGHDKFERNLERSRAGISLILSLLRDARLQTSAYDQYGASLPTTGTAFDSFRPRLFSSSLDTSSHDQSFSHASDSGNSGYQNSYQTPAQRWRWNPLVWLRLSP